MTLTTTDAIDMMAPAKINLALHVCGKRSDGYHLLDSLVVFAGVGDTVSVTPAPDIRLTLTGPFGTALTAEPDNLVLRAARLLANAHGVGDGAHIVLEKNLPVASGIGGGSADAAAALRACARLWNVTPAFSHSDIAAALGADVPVCMQGVPAFMSGIGEVISPAPILPKAWLLLVNPGLPLATKAVFGALAGRYSAPIAREDLAGLETAEALAKVLKGCRNDLMTPALELLPAIGTVIAALEATPDCRLARLSGSGPTCFGLFSDETAARRAGVQIAAQHPLWWTATTQMRDPAQGW